MSHTKLDFSDNMKTPSFFAVLIILLSLSTLEAQYRGPYVPRPTPGRPYVPSPMPGRPTPFVPRPGQPSPHGDMYMRLSSKAVAVKYCTACGKAVPYHTSHNGQICPHCGVHWNTAAQPRTPQATYPPSNPAKKIQSGGGIANDQDKQSPGD